MRIRPRFGSLARGGDRGAKLLELVVEALLVGKQPGQFAVPGVKLRLLRLELDERLFQYLVAARQCRRIEGETVGRLCLARIGAREPEADVKQLFYRAGGVTGTDGFSSCTARLRSVLMYRALANTASPAARRKLGSCRSAEILS